MRFPSSPPWASKAGMTTDFQLFRSDEEAKLLRDKELIVYKKQKTLNFSVNRYMREEHVSSLGSTLWVLPFFVWIGVS
jgi:hypothetical protein